MSTDSLPIDNPPTQVVVAVVINKRRVLVGRRPLGVPLPGYAEFPGGKLQPGETHADAMRRECAEETGLTVSIGNLLTTAWQRYEHGDIEIRFYHCEVIGNSIPTPPFQWVPLDRLASLKFPPANDEVLKIIHRMLED